MEKPILFSASMVQAILAGRKTVTRRIIKNVHPDAVKVGIQQFDRNWRSLGITKPYAKAGDRLWVQENYSLEKTETSSYYICKYDDGERRTISLDLEEETKLLNRKTPLTKKQPGRFMYKSCSRIWLEVKDVRNERLQEITEEGAIAEGIELRKIDGEIYYKNYSSIEVWGNDAIGSFRTLWESIHGVESWNSNPWVFVVEFERIEVKA